MWVDPQFFSAALQRAEARLNSTVLAPRALLVEPLDHSKRLFAAVDAEGAWSLVVVARKSTKPVPALRLTSLSADYGATYQLHTGAATESLRVSVLRCATADPAIKAIFTAFCATLLQGLPAEPSEEDLEHQVARWVALFWRLQQPAKRTVVGLIGELTLLDKVEHFEAWVRAWHSSATDNLDFAFSFPPLSVEVKATTSTQRVHELALSQTEPMSGGNHLFASVLVELRETGTRVGDVVDEFSGKLAGADEGRHFWSVLAEVCGLSIAEFFDVRYMREVARKSLQLYSSSTVPRPRVELPLPAGVSAVRFRSDFSSLPTIEPVTVLGIAGV